MVQRPCGEGKSVGRSRGSCVAPSRSGYKRPRQLNQQQVKPSAAEGIHTNRMNQMLMAMAVLAVLSATQQSWAQPICADSDPVTSKLCLTVLEELLRRSRTQFDSDYSAEPPQRHRIPPEFFDNNLPLVDRGTKRQDVDHVFLRFGR